MAFLRRGLLSIMVIGSVGAVVGSPAFATPTLTGSTGTAIGGGAVAPFVTPSASTRSLFTARSTNAVLKIETVGGVLVATITCRTNVLSGYVSTTHTRIRITSLSFGDGGMADDCSMRTGLGNGPVDRDHITCVVGSNMPWYLNLKTAAGAGTVTATTSCAFTFTMPPGSSCRVTLDAGQSFPAQYSSSGRSFAVISFGGSSSFTLTLTNISTCGLFPIGSYIGTLTGTYPITPDTRRDSVPILTSAS